MVEDVAGEGHGRYEFEQGVVDTARYVDQQRSPFVWNGKSDKFLATGTQRQDIDNWTLPGRTLFLALAYAPFGADGDAGAPIFDPRYGQ